MQKFFFTFLIYLFIGSSTAASQTVIVDDSFDDGDFTNNPSWADPESKHIVNGSNRLQLDAPSATDEAVITTASSAVYGEWEVFIQLGFNPSSSNFAKFYILSDTQNLKGDVNGYYILIGDTENEISLYRQDGNSSTKIIDGPDDLIDRNPVTVRVKATRDVNGNWELLADTSGGTSFVTQDTTTDATHTASSFIGFLSDYTGTRSDLFEYDEVKVTKINPPLRIQDIVIQDNSTFDVHFNLEIDAASVSPSDFAIDNGAGNPNSTSLPSPDIVRLSYGSALTGNEYSLIVNNVDDSDGNTITPNTTATFIIFDSFSPGDIIISEFLYDPPSGQAEYVELKNLTGKFLNLQNWQIGDEAGNSTISTDTLILRPNDFLVISADTTALFNVYGSRPYVQSSNLPSLNNSGDVVKVLTDGGNNADSLQYTTAWGGDDVALERRSDSAPSIYHENFGNSPNPDGGTPGITNVVADDTTPPKLNNLLISGNQTLNLDFTERLAGSNATNPANYSLNNGGITITNAQHTAADNIRLSLANPLQNGITYQLSISNQRDIFGNAAGTIDSSFTYYEVTPADSGDVFINEFMYDPPGESSEYIEIYNPTSESFDLNGWTINDSNGNPQIVTNNSFTVPPDSFVVIARNQTLLQTHPDIALISMGSNFPSLNNSGDDIVLRDSTGQRLDSLSYTTSWDGIEIALERRTTSVKPVKANFSEAPNEFGTPGSANQVTTDNKSPHISSFVILNGQSIQFVFTEQMEMSSTTNINNYRLSGGIGIADVTLSGEDTATVNLSGTLQNNTKYTAVIDGAEDLFGNAITERDTTFTYFEVSPADSGDIFINEFTYDPPEGSTEYIELYNASSKSLDLQNWTINDNTGSIQTITGSQFIVPPDSFVVLAPDKTLLQNKPDIALVPMGSNFPSLNNRGDNIVLRDGSGERLDSLQYTADWGGNSVALERRTTAVEPVKGNFGNAPNATGTPGKTNEIAPDKIPPTLTNLVITSNQTLQLAFSETIAQNEAENSDNYALSNSLSIDTINQTAGDSIEVTFAVPLQNATKYELTVQNQRDIFGNSAAKIDTSFTYFEVTTVDSGDVFINEFMYDPPEGSSEYIELINTTSESYDLNGWTISDNTGNRRSITNRSYILPPKSYILIAPDETLLKDNPNIPLLAIGNRFSSLNNSGDDIVLRDSTGRQLDSLRYNTTWGGSKVALERRTTQAPTLKPNFGNAPNGFGTPGRTNQIEADETAPVLETFSILDARSLQFVFNEELKRSSAVNTENYSLSGEPNINSASLSADTVRVTLSGPLQNNTSYRTTVNGIEDLFGNTLVSRDTTFTYYKVTAVDSGNVFINEFLFHPPAGQVEFIELHNPTNKSLDIKNWTINDNTGNIQVITDRQFIIPPDSFAVISSDETLLINYPNIALVSMGSHFPSLNNSGDDIVLRDPNGQMLDSLRYTSGWGGNEVALERRTIQVEPAQPNFGDAPNGFGTPGTANQIQPDTTPPALNSLRIIDNRTLQFIFSEPVTGATSTDQNNYQISPSRDIQLISAIQDTVTLLLSQQLQSEQSYTITVQNLQDVFGNTLQETSRHKTFVELSEASSGDIVINEFLYTRESAGDPEFVELLNTTDQNFDLSGWQLGDASRTTTLDGGIQLHAGDYLVLTDNASLSNQLKNGVFISNFPSLNDDEDAIYIQNEHGITIDSLFYNAQFGGNIDGKSAERKDPQAASNDPANFATSTADSGSTPGLRNAAFALDESSPSIVFSRIFPNGDIELQFSEFITIIPELTFSLNQQPLSIDSFEPANGNVIYLNTPSGVTTGTELIINAENLSDVKGNVTTSVQQVVAQPLTTGDVVINEILFDPLSDSEDNQPDQSEYIELRNTRDYAISLQNIALHDAPDEDGKVRTLGPVQTTAKYIPAQGTALIYADEASHFKESQTAEFFELSNQAETSLLRVDRSSLSLASTDDAVYLTGNEGTKIDSVFYDESWHNPNLADTDGISLERINPFGPGNEASNWGSSTNVRGGTPNSENSIYQETGNQVQNEFGISFNPNPFSPDDDGTDDRLFINYKLDQPDYLITVHIYDRYGREVRELADGKSAGFEGSLIWDGLKENGNRNRIGIYIVIFKAFDSSSGNNKTFKETVVLARRLH